MGPREGSGEVATCDFVPLFGDPKNAVGTEHFRTLLGPREGRGEEEASSQSGSQSGKQAGREACRNTQLSFCFSGGGGHSYKIRGTKFSEEQSVVEWQNIGPTNSWAPVRIPAARRRRLLAGYNFFLYLTLVQIRQSPPPPPFPTLDLETSL